MFTLKLYDRNGTALSFGDIVKISDGKVFTFFAEVKYLEREKVITPFHTFSFHSIVKVDKVPEGAKKSTEERYDIWYIESPEEDTDSESAENYLTAWRECERLMEKGYYRIEMNK